MAQPPAFQFYAQDYLVGTTTMTLSERGAYMDCLAYQWVSDGIPDDLAALARVMRCTPSEARKVWPAVRRKFEQGPDGLWRNARLERERADQSAYRESKRTAGRAGGLAKAKHKASTASVLPVANGVANGVAKRSSSSSSSVFSSSKNDDDRARPRGAGGVGVIVSPLTYAKTAEKFAFFGERVRVPWTLHHELVAKLGGPDGPDRLHAWYAALNACASESGEPIVDIFEWLRPRFVDWAGSAAAASEYARWAPGGAIDRSVES